MFLPKDFNKEADQKNRITKILEECEKNDLIENTKISIFGLMQGVLHDRYILIFDQANLPLAGFHLSNSLQKEAENYPLLITPIPLDILYELNEYQQKPVFILKSKYLGYIRTDYHLTQTLGADYYTINFSTLSDYEFFSVSEKITEALNTARHTALDKFY